MDSKIIILGFVAILSTLCAIVHADPTNVTEIIQGYGYPCEDHTALTPDGYYLSLQRIPHGKNNAHLKRSRPIVLFQHGLIDNANGVCLNPPPEGLPYILADAGFEVWLGNNRGNGYSMTNTQYNTDQKEFWQFSFDEMASSDLPTEIDYILQTTGASTLSYIGHSEGTTQAFAGFLDANLASKVNVFIALAPVAFVANQRSPVLAAIAPWSNDITFLEELFGGYEFVLNEVIKRMIPDVCVLFPTICNDVLEVFMGPSTETNTSRLPWYLDFEPNPTSTMNVGHWGQLVNSGLFQKFDFGTDGNWQHYNQSTPPQYDIGALPKSLPIAFFTGGNDYLADPTDVQYLRSHLPVPPVFEHNEPDYSHTDFLWAENAATNIYPLVKQLLSKYGRF